MFCTKCATEISPIISRNKEGAIKLRGFKCACSLYTREEIKKHVKKEMELVDAKDKALAKKA